MSDTTTPSAAELSVWEVATREMPPVGGHMVRRAAALDALQQLRIPLDMPYSTLHAALEQAVIAVGRAE